MFRGRNIYDAVIVDVCHYVRVEIELTTVNPKLQA